jgi:hypothetical protein
MMYYLNHARRSNLMSPLHLQEDQRMIMVFSIVVSSKFACFEIGFK